MTTKIFLKNIQKMPRSRKGLGGAGEWHQLKELFPDMKNKTILDLGCGYGWHCKYAAENGAKQILGIDLSEKHDTGSKKEKITTLKSSMKYAAWITSLIRKHI